MERDMDTQRQEKPHKRRVRYKGTHPRKYSEKYKELNPEKYADTIEKVIRKGSTPAGMHISIMVKEILDFLQIQPGQQGLDATLGYGGHTRKMLECLRGEGHIYALDVDPIESAKTKKRLEEAGFGEEILTVKLLNFANIDEVAEEAGCFDFVLADLGVSSMQIDNPERGFSYKVDGPLDLRMNPKRGVSAAERLREVTRDELEGMLVENSDEPYAAEIARAIKGEQKKGNAVDTTTKLRQIIEETLSFLPDKERKETVKKTCQRVFQAIRIDVNSEFEVLEEFLEKLPGVLAPGGRVAVLTFHSGEDRMVKKSFRRFAREGVYSEVSKEVIRPSAEECRRNGRARSTKMRWAVKALLFCGLVTAMFFGKTGAADVRAAERETKQFTLSAAGDCTFASDIKQPSGASFFAMYQKKNPDYFLKKVQSVFAEDDLTLVNFEGTLSDGGTRANKKWAFRGKPGYVKILQKGSVEAVSFSNNHTRDYGEKSHTDTMNILKQGGIAFATETKTALKKVNGIRVGLVAVSSIEPSGNPESQLRTAMKNIRKKKPEVIIVSMHSGIEYTQDIQPVQKRLSRIAIDMGADLVLGHHPHVIQGIDKYKGSYIVYSLGNFCFGGNTNPPDKDTFIFQQTFVVKNGKLKKKTDARVIPCRVSGQDGINNYQPVLSKGGRRENCIARLNFYSKKFGVKVKKDGTVK